MKEEENINEYNKKKEERKGKYDELRRIRENNKNIIYKKVIIFYFIYIYIYILN